MNKNIHIIGLTLFQVKQNGSIWALRPSELANEVQEDHVRGQPHQATDKQCIRETKQDVQQA